MERKQQTAETVEAQRQIAVLSEKLAQTNAVAKKAEDKLHDLKMKRQKQAQDIDLERRQQVDASRAKMVQIAVLEEKLRNTEANVSGIRMVQMLEAQRRTMISTETIYLLFFLCLFCLHWHQVQHIGFGVLFLQFQISINDQVL